MKYSHSALPVSRWLKPVLLVVVAAFIASGCKETGGSSGGMPAPPGGGMPTPPGGGMPAPPGGGMPAPPGGGSPGGGSPGGSSGGESGESDGGPSGESGESPSGESGSGSDDSGGEVGAVPPPPSESGSGGAEHGVGTIGEQNEGEGEGSLFDACGDTGALPGGVGGMGVDGECIPSDSTEPSDNSEDGGSAGEVGEFPEESAEERAERLGQELDESVGGFDEVLANEQREISAVGRNTEGFGNSAEGGSVGGISLGSQASGASGIVVANTGMPSRASPLDAMSTDQINQRTPDDIAMTVDDDIIARQLREAAISEDDPALRDRLWKEYRKYKGIEE